jgi:hypothetical protein
MAAPATPALHVGTPVAYATVKGARRALEACMRGLAVCEFIAVDGNPEQYDDVVIACIKLPTPPLPYVAPVLVYQGWYMAWGVVPTALLFAHADATDLCRVRIERDDCVHPDTVVASLTPMPLYTQPTVPPDDINLDQIESAVRRRLRAYECTTATHTERCEAAFADDDTLGYVILSWFVASIGAGSADCVQTKWLRAERNLALHRMVYGDASAAYAHWPRARVDGAVAAAADGPLVGVRWTDDMGMFQYVMPSAPNAALGGGGMLGGYIFLHPLYWTQHLLLRTLESTHKRNVAGARRSGAATFFDTHEVGRRLTTLRDDVCRKLRAWRMRERASPVEIDLRKRSSHFRCTADMLAVVGGVTPITDIEDLLFAAPACMYHLGEEAFDGGAGDRAGGRHLVHKERDIFYAHVLENGIAPDAFVDRMAVGRDPKYAREVIKRGVESTSPPRVTCRRDARASWARRTRTTVPCVHTYTAVRPRTRSA